MIHAGRRPVRGLTPTTTSTYSTAPGPDLDGTAAIGCLEQRSPFHDLPRNEFRVPARAPDER